MKSYDEVFFNKTEILLKEDFYKFTDRKKIVVFVPYEYADKLTHEMSGANAGLIGNYEMCSFRTTGTGTFKPNSRAKPFSGKKNELSFAEEYKLEMECAPENLNGVIDSVLKSHPYDEAVYEVYDFKKREKKPCGKVFYLRSKIKFSKLIGRINKFVKIEKKYPEFEINRLAVININIDTEVIQSAEFINCDCVVSRLPKKINLIKI